MLTAVFCWIMAATFKAHAQTRINFSFDSGLSWVPYQDSLTENLPKFYYGGAIGTSFFSDKKLNVETKIGLNAKGWRFTNFDDSKGTMRLSYIGSEVFGVYNINSKIKTQAGVNVQYLLKVKRLPDFATIVPNYTKYDISILLGVSYRLNRLLSIGVNYNHGQVQLLDKSITGLDNFKNRSLFVRVTYDL